MLTDVYLSSPSKFLQVRLIQKKRPSGFHVFIIIFDGIITF